MKLLKQRLLNGISYDAVDIACSKEHLEWFHRTVVEFLRRDPREANAWLRRTGLIGRSDIAKLAGQR